LKSVLPAIAPELNYEALEITSGDQAGCLWHEMIHGRSRLYNQGKRALLTYCKQDTLGMARIIAHLLTVAKSTT
jgi:hypothetical protein